MAFGLIRILFVAVLGGCVSMSALQGQRGRKSFLLLLESQPHLIWSAQVGQKVRDAQSAFQAHQNVDHGLVYGDSVRNFSLKNKCASEISHQLLKMGCPRKEDVLQDAKTHQPLRTSDGKTIPMWIFLCPDGGVVRVKPVGDPMSRFRPQPHASKSLRYPYDSKFESFDDEIAKVDDRGEMIPKWSKDLDLTQVPVADQKTFIEDWANDAHSNLKHDCE